MNNQVVLSAVTTRSRKQIRLSTILLSLILIVNIVVVLFFAQQSDLRRAEFEHNSNLHLVDVLGREDGSYVAPLTTADLASISEISTGVAEATVSALYGFGTGFELAEGESVTLYGIDPTLAEVIGVEAMQDGVAYGLDLGSEEREIQIPILSEVDESGVVSTDVATTHIAFSSEVDPVRFDYLTSGAPGLEGYVTTDTYWSIAEQMFGANRAAIIQEYDAGRIEMIPVYSGALVQVSDYHRVRDVAAALDSKGYSSGFALRAFDSIESGLQLQRNLSFAVVGFTALAAIVFFIVTWRSYLALSRRDIGILKHWKLAETTIIEQYARVLLRTVTYPVLVSGATTFVAALVLFPPAVAAQRFAVTLVLLVVGGGLLYAGIRRWLIRTHVRLDVLTLLNHERQFQ